MQAGQGKARQEKTDDHHEKSACNEGIHSVRRTRRCALRPLCKTLEVVYYYTLVNSKELIKRLEKAGWKQVSSKGSHVKFKHDEKAGIVIVPHPKKDLPIGTIRAIEKQAGLH